jgi:hypothetical protein
VVTGEGGGELEVEVEVEVRETMESDRDGVALGGPSKARPSAALRYGAARMDGDGDGDCDGECE